MNTQGDTLEFTIARMRQIWQTLEQVFNARLTLHDHTGAFILPDGIKLLPGVNIHCSECCAFWYSSRERCNSHCSFRSARLAAEKKQAFLSTCFCGVTEVVMPLYSGKIHAATIFAGMYRKNDFDDSAFPLRYRKLYRNLPEWSDEKREVLETMLFSAGYTMLALAENLRNLYSMEQGRNGIIRKFFRTRYAENVGVSDLAEELKLSESRTIHILLQDFQKGFSQLLAEERLKNVERLLADSTLPLKKIAELTGFSNEYYLSSVFKKKFGISPGAKRKSFQ